MISYPEYKGAFALRRSIMRVPLLDLRQNLAPMRDEIVNAVTGVIDSTRYVLGPRVEELEEKLAAYSGARYGVGVSSGTDALLVALMALGIGPGDLVVTTPYSFFATMGSILRVGARPYFIDIEPESFNIDTAQLAEVLDDSDKRERIKAIMPVHLYGQCADMNSIMTLASRYGLAVIEDAAQAIGAVCPMTGGDDESWLRAGAMGDAGCFSFFPSKNLGGIGDGGMIVTGDEDLAGFMRNLRMHGETSRYHHAFVGGNFRLDPVQAVVLSIKLDYLESWHAARRANADLYDRLFEQSGLVAAGLIAPPPRVYAGLAAAAGEAGINHHIFNQYVIRARERDRLAAFLADNEIGAAIYYPVTLPKQQCVAGLGYDKLHFPEAERAAAETLALPIYPELADSAQQYVVEIIASFYKDIGLL